MTLPYKITDTVCDVAGKTLFLPPPPLSPFVVLGCHLAISSARNISHFVTSIEPSSSKFHISWATSTNT